MTQNVVRNSYKSDILLPGFILAIFLSVPLAALAFNVDVVTGPLNGASSFTISSTSTAMGCAAIDYGNGVAGLPIFKYGGVNVTMATSSQDGSNGYASAVYYLNAPPTGTNSVTFTNSPATYVLKCVSLTGGSIAREDFFSNSVTGGGANHDAISFTAANSGDFYIDSLGYSTDSYAVGAGQTSFENNSLLASGMSYSVGTSTNVGTMWNGFRAMTGGNSFSHSALRLSSSATTPPSLGDVKFDFPTNGTSTPDFLYWTIEADNVTDFTPKNWALYYSQSTTTLYADHSQFVAARNVTHGQILQSFLKNTTLATGTWYGQLFLNNNGGTNYAQSDVISWTITSGSQVAGGNGVTTTTFNFIPRPTSDCGTEPGLTDIPGGIFWAGCSLWNFGVNKLIDAGTGYVDLVKSQTEQVYPFRFPALMLDSLNNNSSSINFSGASASTSLPFFDSSDTIVIADSDTLTRVIGPQGKSLLFAFQDWILTGLKVYVGFATLFL